MRKMMVLGVVVVMVAMIQGCIVPSVHPLYGSAEDTIYDPALVGRWVDDDGEVWEFSEKREKGDALSHYLVTVNDDSGAVGILEARLVQVMSYRFLDIVPYDFEYTATTSSLVSAMSNVVSPYPHGFSYTPANDSDKTPGLWINNALLFPTHSFLRVRLSGDALEMAFLDFEWITTHAGNGELGLAHETEGDLVLITASPEALRSFMLAHAEDEEVFPMETLRRE